MNRLFYSVLVLSVILVACFSANKISNKNVAQIYRHSYMTKAPLYKVSHHKGDSSVLHIKVGAEDVGYNADEAGTMTTNYRIEVKIFPSFEHNQLVDSFSHHFENPKSNVSFYYKALPFRNRLQFGVMEIEFTDINARRKYRQYIMLNKVETSSEQYFEWLSGTTRVPSFSHYVVTSTAEDPHPIAIKHATEKPSHFYITQYPPLNEPSPPPFVRKGTPPPPDPVKKWEHSAHKLFYPENAGVYRIQVDTTHKNALHFFCAGGDFPEVTVANELAWALRYITKNEEYQQLMQADDTKKAIDKFWLARAGSRERAKQLIKEYYTRVQDANYFFTSYKTGWQTDRGMIYIIYGNPDAVYKNDQGEQWVYEATLNSPAISFEFDRFRHDMSDNHYVLKRSPVYEDTWNIAVHNWRHGRINEITR